MTEGNLRNMLKTIQVAESDGTVAISGMAPVNDELKRFVVFRRLRSNQTERNKIDRIKKIWFEEMEEFNQEQESYA